MHCFFLVASLKALAPAINHIHLFLNAEHLSEPGTAFYFYNPGKNEAWTRLLFKAGLWDKLKNSVKVICSVTWARSFTPLFYFHPCLFTQRCHGDQEMQGCGQLLLTGRTGSSPESSSAATGGHRHTHTHRPRPCAHDSCWHHQGNYWSCCLSEKGAALVDLSSSSLSRVLRLFCLFSVKKKKTFFSFSPTCDFQVGSSLLLWLQAAWRADRACC